MHNQLREIGPCTQKHLWWIVNSSHYKKVRQEIRKLHAANQLEEFRKEAERLYSHFLVPKKLHPTLLGLILGDQEGEIPLNIDIKEIRKDTEQFNIQAPAIVITLQDKITQRQFESLWERVNAYQTGKFSNPHMPQRKPLFTGKLTTKPCFEQYFEWYKQHLSGKKYQMIVEDEGLSRTKDRKDIQKAVRPIKKIMKGMEGELQCPAEEWV